MPTINFGITTSVANESCCDRTDGKQAPVGLYVRDGEVYQVRPAKADLDRHYALYVGNLFDGSVANEYAKGMAYRLKDSERMTADEAKRYGDGTGRCAWCGYRLTSPESIRLGIGPQCRRYIRKSITKVNDR